MGIDALTEKEKATLRLIVRGHDAKSIARHFDLSVHTINERLRDARRKLGVPSSREAARLLDAHETPENIGDTAFGDDATRAGDNVPMRGAASRRVPLIVGAVVMSLAFALLLVAVPQTATPTTAVTAADRGAETAARTWLALVDTGRWDESFQQTGGDFRRLNTATTWAQVSQKVRAPLGAVRSRTLIGQEEVPAGPGGYVLVKFRTSFANKADATETLTLAQENGVWRIMGIYIA